LYAALTQEFFNAGDLLVVDGSTLGQFGRECIHDGDRVANSVQAECQNLRDRFYGLALLRSRSTLGNSDTMPPSDTGILGHFGAVFVFVV